MEDLLILKVDVRWFEVFLEMLFFGLYRAPNYYFVQMDDALEPVVVKAVDFEALCEKLRGA